MSASIPAFESATALIERLRARKVGARELLEYYIRRIERYDGMINAVIVRDFARARERADAADRALGRGERAGPLHGLPMTIKESFHFAGTPTTFGFPQFRDNVATTNAVVVERLLNAGAVIFGKSNVPPGLMDGQSWNEIHGRTNNPWDRSRTPGGSSGGAAAALAAGLTGLELGSDIASSIRNPAHYCGVFGHKPTYGLCPQRGHMVLEMLQSVDIGVMGPLARSARDLELELSVIAGPAGAEAGAYSLALPRACKQNLKDFRVAIVTDDPFARVDRRVQEQLVKLTSFLVGEGTSVGEGERPGFDTEEYYRLFMVLLRAAGAAGVTDEEFARDAALGRGASVATREMARLNAYGATLSHRDWLRLDEKRQRYRENWREFFERFDLLLCPVLATPAFPHSTVPPQERTLTVNGREEPFEKQLFWAACAGLCYLPASVAPIGLSPEGLPVGVQIIGPQYGDLTCLKFAQLLEDHYRAFAAPPGFGD
ncbi:MAG TPA: amidase [Steroidobacteraceae bacterium]|nr:amidase [Steroidobacteraceae bacterium]